MEDFFDVPSPAISVCADFLEVYQQFSVPVFAIPGNHDLLGITLQPSPELCLVSLLGWALCDWWGESLSILRK